MKSQYKLVGFINLFNIVPDFVLPVFENENQLYFQERKNNSILEFSEAKQTIRDRIILLDAINDNLPCSFVEIDSSPIYAFQENSQKVIFGDADVLKNYFENYTPSNDVLNSEISDFLEEISTEVSKENNYQSMTPTFFYGTGRRKSSVARVRVLEGSGNIIINGRDINDYFGLATLKYIVKQPLVITENSNKFDIICTVAGGGVTGQAGAICHGLSRALLQANGDLRPVLKKAGLLTRDPRMKERKKYGLKAARRAPQFSKR